METAVRNSVGAIAFFKMLVYIEFVCVLLGCMSCPIGHLADRCHAVVF